MKKRNLFCAISAILLLLLVSCGENTDGSSSSSSMPSSTNFSSSSSLSSNNLSSSSSVGQGSYTPITNWDANDIATMQSMLTQVIPLAPVSSDYVFLVDEDETGEYIYIYDETIGDICDAYETILEDNGYTYDSSLDEDGYANNRVDFYTKSLTEESDLVIQVDYFLGDTEYLARFEIFAWLESYQDIDYISDWTASDKTLMQQTLGQSLPVAPIMDGYSLTVENDEDGDYIYILDENVGDVSAIYGEILLNAEYEFVETITDTDGDFDFYSLAIDESQMIVVQVDFYAEIYFEIYAWIEAIPEELAAWPTEQIAEVLAKYNQNFTLPSFDGASSYVFNDYSDESNSMIYVEIIATGVTETAITSYQSRLTDAHWITYATILSSINTDTYETYYAMDETKTYVIEYLYDDSESAFYIYISGYDQVPLEAWPTDAIATVTNIDLPVFEADYYLVEQDSYFYIAAYNQTIDSENTYKALLEAAGWEIDDSNYETDGYYALDPTGELGIYFYWNVDNIFYIFLDL